MSEMKVLQKIHKGQSREQVPVGFCRKGAFFVDFEERYAIDGRLLGRKTDIRYNDCYLRILIPSVVKKNGIPELGIPRLIENYGADLDTWGKINNYQDLNKPETIHAWLSSVLVVCYAKDGQHSLLSSEAQKLAKKVVYALQIINPDAIRISSDEVVNNLCEIKHSISYNEGGKPQMEIRIASVIDDGKGSLTIKDIHSAIRNADKSVTAPFEMIGNARMNLYRHDFRAAVLNCATSVEVMLKKMVADYFVSTQTTGELQEYVMRQADGYSKLLELCKKLKISLSGMTNVQESIMKVRNRVIHGGYVPTYEEADKAYKTTRQVLSVMNVPMFE